MWVRLGPEKNIVEADSCLCTQCAFVLAGQHGVALEISLVVASFALCMSVGSRIFTFSLC